VSSIERKRRTAGRVTIRQVADQVGVSAITISRYFKQPASVSEDLRQRIAHAVAATGYVPNQMAGSLASANSRIVGLVIPNISGPIFANTIQSISDTLSAHGYQLMLASSYFSADKEEDAVRMFLGWSPAALVLTSHFHTEATETMIAQAGIPVIEIWDLQQRTPVQIGFRHQEVGRMAATYLQQKGYRHIAFVTNSLSGDLSALERRDGYLEILAEYNMPALVFTPTVAEPLAAGEEALLALVNSSTGVDAIIFANDNLACGAILAAQRHGIRIPQDCAILGFGNYAMSDKLQPALSTISPPSAEIGEVAARHILELAGVLDPHPQHGQSYELQCQLVERQST